MVNLLFIATNPKIDFIKNSLQPLLKLKIDVVDDFDFGLKEVFEKRPAIVFIQDQIAGVTGENVARHIKMLLGTNAPTFILIHENYPNAKPIKGLFDYLIDLSQDNSIILEEIQSFLKLLLAPHWQKIYAYSQESGPEVMPVPDVTENRRINDDKNLSDNNTDLDEIIEHFNNNTQLHVDSLPEFVRDKPTKEESVFCDHLDEIIAKTASEYIKKESVTEKESDTYAGFDSAAPNPAFPFSDFTPEGISIHKLTNTSHDVAATSDKNIVSPSPVLENKPSARSEISEEIEGKNKFPLNSPANFKIARDIKAGEAYLKDSLRKIEAEHYSKHATSRKYQTAFAVFVMCLIVGGWYLAKREPDFIRSLVKVSNLEKIIAPSNRPITQYAAQAPIIEKSVSTAHRQVKSALPSFIPLSGHDQIYASQKSGWERYVGTDTEFRVYLPAGKLKALQVLATKDHTISKTEFKNILIELTGTSEYKTISHEQKFGFQVVRATVNGKTDLLIYQKKSAVRAFVVSLD